MTIGTDAVIDFFGTRDDLENTSSAVSAAAFSDGTNDLNAWTNDDDAVEAMATLEFTLATTGAAGVYIDLYARLMNIGDAGTEDAEVSDANFLHTYMGSFPHNNPSTGAQTHAIPITLPNVVTSQIYEFYIHNTAGQTISAGWKLIISPKAKGPHA